MATKNVNSSELGLLAQTDPDAAAHRIFDAHARHATLQAVAEELGVTPFTMNAWEKRLAREQLWDRKRVRLQLPDGTRLAPGITLEKAIQRARAFHADPKGHGEPVDPKAVALARKRLRTVIERMEKVRRGGKVPKAPQLPENLTELGRPFALDKYRLSRFAHQNGDLPPQKLRALIEYLEQILNPAALAATHPRVARLVTKEKPLRSRRA